MSQLSENHSNHSDRSLEENCDDSSSYDSESCGEDDAYENQEEVESNLDILCEKVFTKPPSAPCSWRLYLDEDIAMNIPENEHAMYIFEILVQILFGGIKLLFGTNEDGKISLSSLTMTDFELLRSYFRMMEYDIILDMYGVDSLDTPDYKKFDPTDFSTVHLKFLKTFEDVPRSLDPTGAPEPVYVDIHFTNYAPPEKPVYLEATLNPNAYRPDTYY